MPDQNHDWDQTDSRYQTGAHAPSGSECTTREQLARIAELVAIGEMSVPNGLSPMDTDWLEHRIRDLRRQRLIGFIARQIAMTIHRDRLARKESVL